MPLWFYGTRALSLMVGASLSELCATTYRGGREAASSFLSLVLIRVSQLSYASSRRSGVAQMAGDDRGGLCGSKNSGACCPLVASKSLILPPISNVTPIFCHGGSQRRLKSARPISGTPSRSWAAERCACNSHPRRCCIARSASILPRRIGSSASTAYHC